MSRERLDVQIRQNETWPVWVRRTWDIIKILFISGILLFIATIIWIAADPAANKTP